MMEQRVSNPFQILGSKIARSLVEELSLINGAGDRIPFLGSMFEEQRQAWEAKERHIALAAGKQGAKTVTGIALLLREVENHLKDDFMIITPTVKRMNQSTLKKFLEMAKPLKIGYHLKQEAVYKLHNGGNIYLRTVEEDPETIEGATLRAILADEAGDMPYKAYLNMRARVSILRGRIFLTSSLYTANWFYEIVNPEYFAKEKDPLFFVMNYESVKNPSFSTEEFEELRNSMDPKDFDREYRAAMNRFEGLVYELRDYNKKHKLPEKPFLEVIAGCDWGYMHPSAITVTGLDENYDPWVVDEFYGKKILPDDLVTRAKELYEKHHFSVIYCDNRRPELIAMMVREGLPAYPQRKTDVADGISVVRGYLTSGRLKIYVPACPNTIREPSLYHYKDTDDPYAPEVPVDLYNDCLDTVRMQLTSHHIPKGGIVEEREPLKNISQLDVERTMKRLEEGYEDEYEEVLL